MKKFKDSLHIFSPKNKRFNDNKKNEIQKGVIYEIGNEIEENFDEDVENIKFNADDISSFFLKNNESENKEEYLKYEDENETRKNIYKKMENNKMETLFNPTFNGPYICCIIILSRQENVELEFIYPSIDINEENMLKKKNIKIIAPFNVWFRYKGEWIEDIKMLILERMNLFKDINMSNILCDFNNYKSNNHEYNILYGESGNKYYLIALDYLEDNKCKEIMMISQIPYFNILSIKFHSVIQSFLVKKDYKILENFIDSFSSDKIFEDITFDDYYINLSKDIEHINNIKIKNILIFLKAILLERKIAILCSEKGNACKILLLLLSFIPDIINFGFNIRNYEEKFEEWIKLKLPLILFHENYILLLHIDNLKVFNDFTEGKNYLLSTNVDSDVHNFIKNDLDILYDVDKDNLIIRNEKLINALELTKFENNYLKKIHSSFKPFFNLTSFFENIKQNDKIINTHNINYSNTKINNINNVNSINNRICNNYGNKDNTNNINNNIMSNENNTYNTNNISNNNIYNKDETNEIEKNNYMKNNKQLLKENSTNEKEIQEDKKKKLNKNDINKLNNNILYTKFSSNEYSDEKYEYIDDEEDIYVINTRSQTLKEKQHKNYIEINENMINNNEKENSLKNDETEKYVTHLRNHFHIYFNDFFFLSKENFEEGIKEKKELYELNYNKFFIEIWQGETKNYNFFIEKDFKINKFLKIAEQNNMLFDKKNIEDYNFVDDMLIIQKKEDTKKEIYKNLKQVLIMSLKGYIYDGSYCILKNCKEGLGKFIYNKYGITFEGEWENDQINGSGHLYTNNFKYFGKFENNLFNGNGIFVDNLLNQYEGEFLNGYFNGNGKLIFNGNTYIGIFENNNLVGKGKILYKNGSIYTGEIKNFMPHGYGFLSYNKSTVFEGFFIGGKKNGNGFLTINYNSTPNNVFCIEGKWKNDEPVIRKNFNIIFPNKDKYIGKIYILSNLKNINKDNDTRDDTIVKDINEKLFDVKELIENKITYINQDNNKIVNNKNDILKEKNVINDTSNIHYNNTIPTLKSNNSLENENIKKKNMPLNDNQKKQLMEHDCDNNSNSENINSFKNRTLMEKLEIFVNNKERKLLRKSFEILDKNWIYSTEKKLRKNKDVVEYLQQKKLFIIPHSKGLSIYNRKKENYDGNFCLGMKHGYGISMFDDINRYEGYWFRGMKHGYGILYEGDNIYYAHFNYDKLIKKEEILPEQINNYKPKKDPNIKTYNNFLINQSFFDYKNFISTFLFNYL
ncbi:MORN repeat protein, putative [Plasmodium gallinaceum]|uniref:MORN repeat protein, putative n=1 Tax=Plasmodium gallinaceum TaxID=5849 RepID=A0A1J1H3G8_PLAGA|nr:MORN repeat protein, putative [Plasmodium gallinaceum]CRG97888.1 MORN repeat protein, putative [Plasmodium gallinaceum]